MRQIKLSLITSSSLANRTSYVIAQARTNQITRCEIPLIDVFFFFFLNPRIYLLKGANLRFKGKYHYTDKYKPPIPLIDDWLDTCISSLVFFSFS